MGFGTYRWSGAPDHVAALRRALDLGCSLVDTAPNYAPAEVRSRLGQVLAPHRSQVRIVSKGGYLPGGGYSLDAPFLRSLIHSDDHPARRSSHPPRIGPAADREPVDDDRRRRRLHPRRLGLDRPHLDRHRPAHA